MLLKLLESKNRYFNRFGVQILGDSEVSISGQRSVTTSSAMIVCDNGMEFTIDIHAFESYS